MLFWLQLTKIAWALFSRELSGRIPTPLARLPASLLQRSAHGSPTPGSLWGLLGVLYSHCVLHRVRSPASGRQGSVPGISTVVAGPGNSVTVYCTHIWIIKKANSCSWPMWWILIIVNPNVLIPEQLFLPMESHFSAANFSSFHTHLSWWCFIYQYYGALEYTALSFVWTRCYLVR